MPSPAGWREVPCVECGKFVAGINFVERCPECLERRQKRAGWIASRAAVGATIVCAIWIFVHLPQSGIGRWYAGVGIAATYLLVRVIVKRFVMGVLP